MFALNTETASGVSSRFSALGFGDRARLCSTFIGVNSHLQLRCTSDKTYDSVDRLTEKHLPNGVVSTYGYDDRDRVLSVVHTGASGVLASVTYERSASGEPNRITREDGSYVVLTYDAALRLDTETYYAAGGGVVDAIDYDYDLDGNRTRKSSLAGGAEDYSYSAGFKLDSVTRSTGVDSFIYDGGGRVTGITRDGSTRSLEYNSDDKITHISGGSTDVRYSYDGVGRRVGKTEGGVSTRYLIAPNLGDGFESPQAVTDGSGNVVATFVYAGEHPIAKITPTGVEYFLQDGMGSVIGKANSAGGSTASIKYDGFGNITSATGASAGIDPNVGTEPRFQGMALDQASGLYFVRARTYDPRTGRFLSRDPVAGVTGRPETYLAYAFANNNPNAWRDPSGKATILELVAVYAIISVLGSIAGPSFQKYLYNARAYRDGTNFAAQDYAAGIGDFLSFTLGKTLRDLLGLSAEVDTNSAAYHAGSVTAFGLQLWRSLLMGIANTTVRAGSLVTESSSQGLSGDALVEATEGIVGNGGKMLGAAQLLSRATGISPAQKLTFMQEFFARINFITSKRGVVAAGEDLLIYSEKEEYAFRFAASGRIIYGKFNKALGDYFWSEL